MATKVTCDKCHKDCTPNHVTTEVNAHGIANDLELRLDLCPQCTGRLKGFLSPDDKDEKAA